MILDLLTFQKFFQIRKKKSTQCVTIICVLVILSLALTACGGSQIKCDDSIECVTYKPDEPIRIASALVITGQDATLGLDSLHSIEIAIDFRGEIKGHSIDLQSFDEGCSADGGLDAGKKIVSDPTIIAIIGTSCSVAGVTMSEVVSEAGYVMISPSNTSPILTDPTDSWYPGYLRTAHNDKVGKFMAEFAYSELDVTTAASIHDGDPYTKSLAGVFSNSFKELGGIIVEFAAINKGDTDMRPVLQGIADAGPPELLFYPVFVAEGSLLTKQAKEITSLENTILATADGMISKEANEALGAAGEGVYFFGPDISSSSDQYKQFLAAFEEKNDTIPTSVFYAHAFDATNMIFNCIEEIALQERNGTIHIGRQALRTCLYSTSGFEGLTGRITCNEVGDCNDPKIAVYQLQSGEYVRIWP
jgi:branched-chain amino acid transport system substrate-binding protein